MAKSVVKINSSISFGKRSGSIMETTKAAIEPDSLSIVTSNLGDIARWGSDNDRPQQIIDENMKEGSSVGALRFKIWAHYGAGLEFHTRRVEKDKEIITPIPLDALPTEMEDFFFENDLENMQQGIISDFEWWSFFYMQYIPNASKNKILKVKWQRAKDIRAIVRDNVHGTIPGYALSGYWPSPRSDQYTPVAAFDRTAPFAKPNAIYRHGLPSIDKDYYPTPYWQANMKWLAVAQKIPDWINANIDNSVNIKYHIRIPEEYFLSLYPDELYDSVQEATAARQVAEEEIKQMMDDMLSGRDNVSKIFYSKIAIDESGAPLPGWEINPLTNDIKDGAWLNAYGTAAVANATAHGTPPDLMGLVLPSGLGAGSGSNIREAFNTYVQLHTVIPRQTTLEWFQFVKRFNKWPKEIHMGYRGIVLQTLDQNKTGVAKANETNPTTENE